MTSNIPENEKTNVECRAYVCTSLTAQPAHGQRPAALPPPPALQSQRSAGCLPGCPADALARLGSGAWERGVGAGGRAARWHGTGWTHAASGKGRLNFLYSASVLRIASRRSFASPILYRLKHRVRPRLKEAWDYLRIKRELSFEEGEG